MMETTCLEGSTGTAAPRFTRDEVTALFLNLLLFDGDWEEHLRFLESSEMAEEDAAEMRSVVERLREKDRELNIQSRIRTATER